MLPPSLTKPKLELPAIYYKNGGFVKKRKIYKYQKSN